MQFDLVRMLSPTPLISRAFSHSTGLTARLPARCLPALSLVLHTLTARQTARCLLYASQNIALARRITLLVCFAHLAYCVLLGLFAGSVAQSTGRSAFDVIEVAAYHGGLVVVRILVGWFRHVGRGNRDRAGHVKGGVFVGADAMFLLRLGEHNPRARAFDGNTYALLLHCSAH